MQSLSLVLSERKLAANRSNARKSTGPRTPAGKIRSSLNSLKHGRYAQRVRMVAQELGEDPHENEAMLEELLAAYRPVNAAERMLVEDIAALRLQRRRSDRAQAGRQAFAAEKLELERRRNVVRMRRIAPQPENWTMAGIIHAPASIGRFELMLDCLRKVTASLENRELSPAMVETLRTVYGRNPENVDTAVQEYEDLVESPPDAPGIEDRTDGLRRKLEERSSILSEELEVFKAYEVQVSPAQQDAALAPEGNEWKLLIRQANSIDRCLDRKIRLLMQLQNRRSRSHRRGLRGAEKRMQNNPLKRGTKPRN